MKSKIAPLVMVLITAFNMGESVAGGYRELLPTRNSSIDEEQVMAFYLGPVVFQIKNRLLVFPYPRGDHPFDASICGEENLSSFQKPVCSATKKSVFLQIPVAPNYAGELVPSFVSLVTLGYGQQYVFDENSVEEFASEVHPWELWRERMTKLDTNSYAAVRSFPSSYFFVGKGLQSPHVVVCQAPLGVTDIPEKAECTGRTGFLVKDFPRLSNGTYAFTLEYSFPGAQLDHASDIQEAIVDAVSAFPHWSAPPGWGVPTKQPTGSDAP